MMLMKEYGKKQGVKARAGRGPGREWKSEMMATEGSQDTVPEGRERVCCEEEREERRTETSSKHLGIGTSESAGRQRSQPRRSSSLLSPSSTWKVPTLAYLAHFKLSARFRARRVPRASRLTPPGAGPRPSARSRSRSCFVLGRGRCIGSGWIATSSSVSSETTMAVEADAAKAESPRAEPVDDDADDEKSSDEPWFDRPD